MLAVCVGMLLWNHLLLVYRRQYFRFITLAAYCVAEPRVRDNRICWKYRNFSHLSSIYIFHVLHRRNYEHFPTYIRHALIENHSVLQLFAIWVSYCSVHPLICVFVLSLVVESAGDRVDEQTTWFGHDASVSDPHHTKLKDRSSRLYLFVMPEGVLLSNVKLA